MIEIIEVDGTLHVLSCGGGQVRQFAAGEAAVAARAAAFARFALRRLARSLPGDDPESALAILADVGPKLQATLLGAVAWFLGDGPVVIVPPARLHTTPWPVLPALQDRPVSVAPSASAWMRANRIGLPAHRHVTFAQGPGLSSQGAEIAARGNAVRRCHGAGWQRRPPPRTVPGRAGRGCGWHTSRPMAILPRRQPAAVVAEHA